MKRDFAAFLAVIAMASSAYGMPTYYQIADHAQAQIEARQRNLPLAWVGGFPEQLGETDPERDGPADLSQMAMNTIGDNAVIIFFDGRNMAPVPAIVHAQFHIPDDGPLPGGAAWLTPKVVFTNPEVTRILGRVSSTQMMARREAALYPVLQAIRDNPAAMQVPLPPPPAPTAPAPTADTSVDDGAGGFDTRLGRLPLTPEMAQFLNQNRDSLKFAAGGLCALLLLMVWFRRRS